MKNFKDEVIDCPECGGGGARSYMGNTDILGVACGYCNATGKIKSDYLIVTDPKVAVEFLGKKGKSAISAWYGKIIINNNKITLDGVVCSQGIKIHKSVVKEICEPKEGDAVFIINLKDDDDYEYPFYTEYKQILSVIEKQTHYVIKANALSTGLPVGELKEFCNWYSVLENNG